MYFPIFLIQYYFWHYGKGVRNFLSLWGNFLWFAYNFFSIPLLLKTLFSPFERLSEEYKKGLDVGALFGTLLVNTLMRFVGALVRLFIIGMGIVALFALGAIGLALFVIWLTLPLIVVAFVAFGIHGIILWQ